MVSDEDRREGLAFVRAAREIDAQWQLGSLRTYLWKRKEAAFFPKNGETDFVKEALASAVFNKQGGELVVEAILNEAKALDRAGASGCERKVFDTMIEIAQGKKFWSVIHDAAELRQEAGT